MGCDRIWGVALHRDGYHDYCSFVSEEKVSSFLLKNSCILLSGNIELCCCLWQGVRGCVKVATSECFLAAYPLFSILLRDGGIGFWTALLPATLFPVWISHRGGARGSQQGGSGRKDFPGFLLSPHGLQFLYDARDHHPNTLVAPLPPCGSSWIKLEVFLTLEGLASNSPVSEKPDLTGWNLLLRGLGFSSQLLPLRLELNNSHISIVFPCLRGRNCFLWLLPS